MLHVWFVNAVHRIFMLFVIFVSVFKVTVAIDDDLCC